MLLSMNATLLKTSSLNVCIDKIDVCKNLDWEVRANESWGILGINGIGKTTLLNTLSGLRKPDSGNIVINSTPLSHYNAKKLALTMGYLLQQFPGDFPQTVSEFCIASLHPHIERWKNFSTEDTQKVAAALHQVELAGFENRSVNTLSGGERRRMEIASLFIQDPVIWLLDEPVNHLDMHYQVTMMEKLMTASYQRGGSMISVLHDANLANRFCSHVLLLLGNGEYLAGQTATLLTKHQLGRLYRHPVDVLQDQDKTAFLPG